MGDQIMARLVRLCTQCGAIDDRRAWSSADEAADQGAFAEPWTCSTCAWTEFDLVEEAAPKRGSTYRDERPALERAGVAGGSRGAGVDPTFRSPA
jgi:hypothetical protein